MERLPEFIANHLFLCTLFVSLLILLLWNFFGDSLTGLKPIQPGEVTHLINRDNALVLDIRSEDDYKTGHIINAMNIPSANLQDSVSKLDKHKDDPIILYCQNGVESSRTLRVLKQSGFSQLYFMKGGLTAWQNANFPITKEKA